MSKMSTLREVSSGTGVRGAKRIADYLAGLGIYPQSLKIAEMMGVSPVKGLQPQAPPGGGAPGSMGDTQTHIALGEAGASVGAFSFSGAALWAGARRRRDDLG
jgi:hypothetical protein